MIFTVSSKPSSRNALRVSASFVDAIPSDGTTSTVTVNRSPDPVANFDSTFGVEVRGGRATVRIAITASLGLQERGTSMPVVVASHSFDPHDWAQMARVAEALAATEGAHPVELDELPDLGRWQAAPADAGRLSA